MNFLGIGPGELLLILVLALIIFGPQRLPDIGKALGKSIREVRKASEELTGQFKEEMEAASNELKSASEEIKGEQPEARKEEPDQVKSETGKPAEAIEAQKG